MNTYLHRRSLSTKLRVVVLASTVVALIVALGAMIAVDLATTHRNRTADVEAQADLLGNASAAGVASGDARAVNDTLAVLRFEPEVRSAAAYDAQGRLVARYGADTASSPPPQLAPAEGQAEPVDDAHHDLVVRRAIVDGGRTVGTIVLRARDGLHARVASYAALALMIALLALAATWLVASWLQAIVTRPILEVAAIARDVVQQRDYSRRANKLNEDEVGELVDAFNGMLAEIERRRAEQEVVARDKDREVADRRLAQAEVMRLNAELERRVQERTAQLEASNRDLSAATRDAEAANRAKSEFLSNMSHELRTPLNAIIGFGQLLAHDDPRAAAAADSAARNRGFVNHIVDAGNHLLKLINEILNLAQIEAGKLSMSLEPVELRDVLEECHALTRTASAQRGIRLLFPVETTMRVNADRTRLKQVLLNLLSNAVKYNRDHGAVIVECAPGDEGRVRLSIQDTGQGMTPEELRTLFQPFNRLGRDGSGIEGSGIGLMLTKKLVELMGGMIGVHSTPGSGSTFWVDLRAAEPVHIELAAVAPRLPAPVGSAPAALTTSTILCVDDNRANLALLTEALSLRSDCLVLTATDGQAGVDMARSHRPDVILMDNNMPVMSGREAMRVLRANPLTAGIPVIAVRSTRSYGFTR